MPAQPPAAQAGAGGKPSAVARLVAPHELAWPPPGGGAENATTTDPWPAVAAAHPAPGAGGALPAHLVRCPRRRFPFFFLRPHDDQHGMGQQSQRDVAIPGPKAAHLILIEPYLAFRF